MKKTDIIKILTMLSSAYPNMKEITEITVDIWYDCLKDIDIKIALPAIKKHILESPFPPSVADIRKQISEVTTPEGNRLDGAKAWGEVVKAIGTYGYYREEEAIKNMSPITAKVVKYMGWQEICHSDKPDVIRGQFLKMYDTVAKREEQDRLLPGTFKEELKRIAANNKDSVFKLVDNFDINKALHEKERQA